MNKDECNVDEDKLLMQIVESPNLSTFWLSPVRHKIANQTKLNCRND